MPAISSRTRPKPVRAVIDFGDDSPITVILDRNRVTPRWLDIAKTRAQENDALATSVMLAEVILEWDVTEEDGVTPYPPTAENLAVFPISDQSLMLELIVAAAIPSDAEGKASPATPAEASAGSTATAAPSLNGTQTSTLPVPSASPSLT